MAIGMSYLKPERYSEFVFVAYGGVILLLFLVMAIGQVGGGARSWLDLGLIRIQPSELMKPVLVLALARFYAAVPPREIRRWSAIWPAALLVGFPTLPDPDPARSRHRDADRPGDHRHDVPGRASAAALHRRRAGGRGGRCRSSTISCSCRTSRNGCSSSSTPIRTRSAPAIISPSRRSRSAPAASSARASSTAPRASGDFLPEPHTDFIFAAWAEEWGLLGGLFLILLFVLLVRWGMKVADRARNRFERLAAAGMTATIFFYAAINLMMVMGLAPVVGIPLPLVSYGGSAMLTVMICLGVLMSIDRASRSDERRGRL